MCSDIGNTVIGCLFEIIKDCLHEWQANQYSFWQLFYRCVPVVQVTEIAPELWLESECVDALESRHMCLIKRVLFVRKKPTTSGGELGSCMSGAAGAHTNWCWWLSCDLTWADIQWFCCLQPMSTVGTRCLLSKKIGWVRDSQLCNQTENVAKVADLSKEAKQVWNIWLQQQCFRVGQSNDQMKN